MSQGRVDNFDVFSDNSVTGADSISVTQLNNLAKALIENNLPVFWIKGEVSGIRNYSHLYFDLKDLNSKVSCVIFSRVASNLDFKIENGQQIELRGKVTIYPQSGSYQINVERVRKVGLGELWEAYNRLLNKLKNEGLFNPEYKKSLPIFPQKVGVITSKEGAVIRDVITTLNRRMPNIQIIVYHSAVQGFDAGMQIVQAIRNANRRDEVDILIICRGGGSMQDLWCFNEEVVAREVFASQIPIISAIGHETDTTIIDYVADLRAPTPTAAAELVAISRDEWLNRVTRLETKLKNDLENIINSKTQQLDSYLSSLKYLNPINQIKEKQQRLQLIELQMRDGLNQLIYAKQNVLSQYANKMHTKKVNIDNYKNNIDRLEVRLQTAFNLVIKNKNNSLQMLDKTLSLLNPENVLSRGYAIIKNKNGSVVSNDSAIKNHERLNIQFKDSTISAIADKSYNPKQEELI